MMKTFCRRRKVIMLATLTMGTVAQVSTCQQELALLGLRTAFTAFFLPLNQFLRDVLLAFA